MAHYVFLAHFREILLLFLVRVCDNWGMETTKYLTTAGAASELARGDERCDWCDIEGYSHGTTELAMTTREREEFEQCTGLYLSSDLLSEAEFLAITKFFKL